MKGDIKMKSGKISKAFMCVLAVAAIVVAVGLKVVENPNRVEKVKTVVGSWLGK